MTEEKFVLRLLSAEGDLLAWTTIYAAPKPPEKRASCPFWPVGATPFAIEKDGIAVGMSIHWCDLNIARYKELMENVPVLVGQLFTFLWIEPVWLVAGSYDVPLPATTVSAPVIISVPSGSLTAKAPEY
jgi:hypothetical protein